jgi:antitoxin component of MazEF toxin-antitoxin module
MVVRITRIGNSRGIRIPKDVLDLYRLNDGDELELESGPEGIRLTPIPGKPEKISFAAAYQEMALEVAERQTWDEWDTTAGDGLDD